MDGGRQNGNPPTKTNDTQAAGGGPLGVGGQTFAGMAAELLELGYEPLPIRPGQKRPAPGQWSTLVIDEARIAGWSRQYPDHGIGLRTGQLVAVDIDELDPDLAHRLSHLAVQRFGATLMRVGRWPKRLLMYRASEPFRKLKLGSIEILGAGQQFVAFGTHPDTRQPYHWPFGDTPLDLPLTDLPLIDEVAAATFLAEAAALMPKSATADGRHPAPGRWHQPSGT